MLGTSRRCVVPLVFVVGACGTGETRVDPGDLELRDLLGIAPEVANTWDADQRASARRVLLAGLHEQIDPIPISLESGASIDEQVTRTLAAFDARRFADGGSALGVVHLTKRELRTFVASRTESVATGGTVDALDVQLAERWEHVPVRSIDLFSALSIDAGHARGPIVVDPAPRLAVIAGYIDGSPAHLVVNPVLIAALDPDSVGGPPLETGHVISESSQPPVPTVDPENAGGNPYSFYGSIAECAYAQRTRCEACLPASNCVPVTSTTDGNAECTMLGANAGRGYFLLCINLSLSITSVQRCTTTGAPSCPYDKHAASSLSTIEANANFVENSLCSGPLDTCLAQIYGAPKNSFPTADAGTTTPPPDPPRSTSVSCGDGCSSKNTNCSASPSCNCSGPSCSNSLSCDSACSNSSSQKGCGSCSSGSGTSSSGGGCGGGSPSSSSSCGSCGSSSSGGSCGGSGCGGGSSSSCGSSKCEVAPADPSASFGLALSIVWGGLPIPIAAFMRRRARRRRPQLEQTP